MKPLSLFSLELSKLPVYTADFLIVGSGIAGLFAAYRACSHGSVMVITKQKVEDSNTGRAQGGIAVAIDDEDSPFFHLEDTLKAGDGLCDEEAVEVLVVEGPERVKELITLDVRFDREGEAWALGREAAHGRRRILHAGDATGEEVARALIQECRVQPEIVLREGCVLIDFLLDPRTNRCSGALVLDQQTKGFAVIRSCVTLVATGGAGQLYLNTTNPVVATGDGAAAAYRAGARLMDMEFVQFHPTALSLTGAPPFLISEAVRGEGAFLRNVKGERFMYKYHKLAELAPRDVVARAIVREMLSTDSNHVFLDFNHLDEEFFQQRFPNIWKTCLSYELDMTKGYIPVSPSAHYIMGGICTNAQGETNIPGLYACGEVSCTGVHGANRLASNSLLEGLVFGARAVAVASGLLQEQGRKLPEIPEKLISYKGKSFYDVGERFWKVITKQIKTLMWEKVGIIRSEDLLKEACRELYEIDRQIPFCSPVQEAVETFNLLTLARQTAHAAFLRTESRGGHFRRDCPARNDNYWLRHIFTQI